MSWTPDATNSESALMPASYHPSHHSSFSNPIDHLNDWNRVSSASYNSHAMVSVTRYDVPSLNNNDICWNPEAQDSTNGPYNAYNRDYCDGDNPYNTFGADTRYVWGSSGTQSADAKPPSHHGPSNNSYVVQMSSSPQSITSTFSFSSDESLPREEYINREAKDGTTGSCVDGANMTFQHRQGFCVQDHQIASQFGLPSTTSPAANPSSLNCTGYYTTALRLRTTSSPAPFSAKFREEASFVANSQSTAEFRGSNPVITLENAPGLHQIKEYNLHPVSVLSVNYKAKASDILLVRLICDPRMGLLDSVFFLAAASPKYDVNEDNKLYFNNLKVTKAMLAGRTKGYSFKLSYQLISGGVEVWRSCSQSFFIWSNLNQKGYPKDLRSGYINETADLQSKKKRKLS